MTGDATAPSVSDTVLPGELTTLGLARAAVTVAHTTGTNTWTFGNLFTYTGTSSTTVNKIALFDAASGGNLLLEGLITAVTFAASGDNVTLQLQWFLN
jgi:hypothetical protein